MEENVLRQIFKRFLGIALGSCDEVSVLLGTSWEISIISE